MADIFTIACHLHLRIYLQIVMRHNSATSKVWRGNGSHSLLNEHQLAEMLNVSVALIRKWRLQRKGPRYLKVGPLVRYRLRDAEEWIDALNGGGGHS